LTGLYKWYYNENRYWHQWFDFSNINWNTTSHNIPVSKRVFKIPIGSVSSKKAMKEIEKLMKSYEDDLWFPEDTTLQTKLTRLVRKAKLDNIECQTK